ncbi:hypothetical protein D9M68_877350 [compost metagenome]
MPTLLMRISIFSNDSKITATASFFEKSATIADTFASGNASCNCSRAFCVLSGFLPLMITSAPSCSSFSAIASPIPWVEPLMKARLPFNFKSMFLFL